MAAACSVANQRNVHVMNEETEMKGHVKSKSGGGDPIIQEHVPFASSKQVWDQAARWLALIGGVVNSIAFVLVYTVAGILRPGYSQIHQAISDLGVGPNGSLLDAIAVIHALLLIAFAVGFALSMQQVLTLGWRLSSAALLVLPELALVTAAIFTDAPSTVAIHSLATIVGLVSTISAFIVIGLGLRRDSQWSWWGTYSLVTAVVTLVLIAVEFWTFQPGTPLAPAHLGGLMERVLSVVTLAWYVVFGWRLFVLAGSPQQGQDQATPVKTMEQMRQFESKGS
jgi:hypothetical membrane protein